LRKRGIKGNYLGAVQNSIVRKRNLIVLHFPGIEAKTLGGRNPREKPGNTAK